MELKVHIPNIDFVNKFRKSVKSTLIKYRVYFDDKTNKFSIDDHSDNESDDEIKTDELPNNLNKQFKELGTTNIDNILKFKLKYNSLHFKYYKSENDKNLV